jgi:hypothetical protein
MKLCHLSVEDHVSPLGDGASNCFEMSRLTGR